MSAIWRRISTIVLGHIILNKNSFLSDESLVAVLSSNNHLYLKKQLIA